jgi:signal transduction histidine kinase/ActR/RegA family two-component response regulator
VNKKSAERDIAAPARTDALPEPHQAESAVLVDNSPESRLRDLRDVNERLVVATLRAQDLERQAEAARRQQLNFMAVLAHELRNPVAPIRHAIKLLDSGSLSEEQQKWSRTVITRQVEHMARLLDDLLDSARLTRGELKLQLAPVTLLSIVTDALDSARPLIEKKHHSLEINLPEAAIVLQVDAVRIAQVLSNLLMNAAKYSDADGRITVTATIDPDYVAISVLDAGVGLQAEVIPGLFLMFSQLQSTLDRAEGGLGIGLAFANELVKLHGGRIEVKSEGEGCGSEFTILLPSSMVLESKSMPPEPQTMAPKGASLRILIADDNIDAAESLGMILEMAGHEMVLAHDGITAVEFVEQLRPQVAIIDIGMPKMNGYLVAEKIRSGEWGKEILLIALTGWGQSDDKARALAAGFDHHFTKPVDSDALEALILSEHRNP